MDDDGFTCLLSALEQMCVDRETEQYGRERQCFKNRPHSIDIGRESALERHPSDAVYDNAIC